MPNLDYYPRPDFVRSSLSWLSLNGAWDFLFDDDDVGLIEQWQSNGLPETVSPSASIEDSNTSNIAHTIASQPENLLKENKFEKSPKQHHKRQIIVPYVFQTAASGINEHSAHEVIWYERRIKDIRSQSGQRLLLRFGAVDYEATVWVNGRYIGDHRGGHVPFDFDITDSCDKSSRLTIRVRDSPYDLTQPRGKQYWAAQPESIFYTPSSGIWQSVWLESVPSTRIVDSSGGTILRSDNINDGQLSANISVLGRRAGHPIQVEIETSFKGMVTSTTRESLTRSTDSVHLDANMRLSSEQLQELQSSGATCLEDSWLNGVALWSPEHPMLYDVVIRLLDDSDQCIDGIKTTTGMRSLDWATGDDTFKLNGKPYFQALVLDQGYWPESGMTPPTSTSLREDIELSKQMGFNGCRKHQKVEDPIFFYWADKLGYLVWGEMANGYEFTNEYVERFNQEWMQAVKRDINHPSIITWTPINETWGYPALKDNIEQQNHIRSLYYMTKTLDPTRSINDNCGWEHVCTDLTTFHDYSDGPQLHHICQTMEGILAAKAGRDMFVAGASHKNGAPILCTEFGGVNIAPSKDDKAGDRDWGYTTASDPDDLLRRIEALVMGIVSGGHCCGFVYTQLTDIEQEVNGLYTFDRKAKLDAGKVKSIMNRAQQQYSQIIQNRNVKLKEFGKGD